MIRNLKITKILSTLFTTVSYCLEALREVGTEEAGESIGCFSAKR